MRADVIMVAREKGYCRSEGMSSADGWSILDSRCVKLGEWCCV